MPLGVARLVKVDGVLHRQHRGLPQVGAARARGRVVAQSSEQARLATLGARFNRRWGGKQKCRRHSVPSQGGVVINGKAMKNAGRQWRAQVWAEG
jgi:hypothetical protein